jgi:hypothetical protein
VPPSQAAAASAVARVTTTSPRDEERSVRMGEDLGQGLAGAACRRATAQPAELHEGWSSPHPR